MSIENILLSQGGKTLFDNIMRFMKTLVIKNTQEAEVNETKESYANYTLYRYGKEGSDTILNYTYTEDDMRSAGFSELNITKYKDDPEGLNAISSTNDFVQVLVELKRAQYASSYIDLNPYYKRLMGIPGSIDELILVVNNDKVLEEDPDTIYVHEIDIYTYPDTYDRIFTNRGIDLIMEDNPELEYLRFIDNPIDPYESREAEQFDIIQYDSSGLTDIEINYFFDAYERNKEYLLTKKYSPDFESVYTHYSNFYLILVLFGAFQKFCIGYIDRYSVKDYTDDEIYSILDSEGFSSIKDVNISILHKVVEKLDILKAYRGTEDVFEILLDMTSQGNSSVKRYNLVKKYITDDDGNATIDPTKPLNESVDLAFVDENIFVTDDSDFVIKETNELDYNQFVQADDTWGGVGSYSNDQAKETIQNRIKREILKIPFNKLKTKYIVLSNVIYTNDPYIKFTYLFSLAIQLDGLNSFIFTDVVSYKDTEITLFGLFTALCWGSSIVNDVENPEIIKRDSWTFPNVMKLETRHKLICIAEVSLMEITTIDGIKRSVGSLLANYDLSDYIVSFTTNSGTDVSDIFDQYDEQKECMNRVLEKLESTSSVDELAAWYIINDYNRMDLDIFDAYRGATTFEEFLLTDNIEFLSLIRNDFLEEDNNVNIYEIVSDILNEFRSILLTKTDGVIDISVKSDVDNISEMNDLKKLMDLFTSVYTVLHNVETRTDMTDYPFNNIQFAHTIKSQFLSLEQDNIDFKHNIARAYSSSLKDSFLFDHHTQVDLLFNYYDSFLFEWKSTVEIGEYNADQYSFGHIVSHQLTDFLPSHDDLTFVHRIEIEELP